MRDEPRILPSVRTLLALACATAFLTATPAWGQAVRGTTQIQYQGLDLVGTVGDRDILYSLVQVDVTKRFQEGLDLSAQVLFRDVSFANGPESQRTPRGTLRLTHQWFGASATYRPTRVTDSFGITSHQDETQLSAFVAHQGWPSIQGTWTTRTSEPGASAAVTGRTRTLTATHAFGRFEARGGYFDQSREGTSPSVRADDRRTWTGGASARLGSMRAGLTASYDVSDTRHFVSGHATESDAFHVATVNGSAQHSRQHLSTLSYSFRRNIQSDGFSQTLDDHEGTALTRYALTHALSISGGGGVRSVRTVAGRDVQWYSLVLGSIEGPIRPGWRGGAGFTRSWNWVEKDHARAVNSYQANTRMRIRSGLEVSGTGQISQTDAAGRALVDTLGQRSAVVSQADGAVTATPLRPIQIVYRIRGYRSGPSLFGEASTSTSSLWDLRWNPTTALQLTGSFSKTRGLGPGVPTLRVRQAVVQWTPSRRWELSGSWWRSDESRGDPNAANLPPARENWGARWLWGLTRDLKSTIVYTVADPGQPTRSRRLEATVTLGFGR
jgi:hypothetical protein